MRILNLSFIIIFLSFISTPLLPDSLDSLKPTLDIK